MLDCGSSCGKDAIMLDPVPAVNGSQTSTGAELRSVLGGELMFQLHLL